MTFLLWILLAITIGILIAAYLRYAHANYPKSWRWELLLVGVPFVLGCVLGTALFMGDFSGGSLVLIVLVIGSVVAVLYRFLYVSNMRQVIPKRRASDDGDRP